jgi:hypothetical protein
MTISRLPTPDSTRKSENRVIAFSLKQESMAPGLSEEEGPQEVVRGLSMRGMESWLALTNAATWLELAEAKQKES